jgi:hypothetical protein
MRYAGYLIYSMMMLSAATVAEFRGWTLGSGINQTKVAPKTVRDNPGAYRSHYAFYPRYVGGK